MHSLLLLAFAVPLLSATFGASVSDNDLNGVRINKDENCTCAPDQFEGYLFQKGSYFMERGRRPGMYEIVMQYALNQKKNISAAYILDEKTFKSKAQIIWDYPKHTKYIIVNKPDDEGKTKCFKAKLPDWKPQCLPASAKLLGRFLQGAKESKNQLYLKSYMIADRATSLQATFSMTDDCVPVGSQGTVRAKGVDVFFIEGFSDLSLKISDPKIFTVPAICSQAEVELDEVAQLYSSITTFLSPKEE